MNIACSCRVPYSESELERWHQGTEGGGHHAKKIGIDAVSLPKVYEFAQIVPKLGAKCMILPRFGRFLACK